MREPTLYIPVSESPRDQRPIGFIVLSIVFALAVLLALVYMGEQEAENESLNSQLKAAQDKMALLRVENNQYRTRLEGLESKVVALNEKILSSQTEVSQKDDQLVQCTANYQAAVNEIEGLKQVKGNPEIVLVTSTNGHGVNEPCDNSQIPVTGKIATPDQYKETQETGSVIWKLIVIEGVAVVILFCLVVCLPSRRCV